jgi:hypothetical protein
MEPEYIQLGRDLFEGSSPTVIRLSPGYASLLYLVHLAVPDWHLASQVVYVLFSTLSGWAFYLIAKDLYGGGAARLTLLLLTVLPNLGPAVAGYSHTIVVSLFFLCMLLFSGWRLLTGPATASGVVGAAAFGLLATLVRPESLLYVVGFACLYVVVSAARSASPKARLGAVCPAVLVLALYSAGVVGQHFFLKNRTNSKYMGFFTDKIYSYTTFTHTLSMRAVGHIDGRVAEALASEAFGAAEGNNYSIVRAIARNPREELKNLLFNAKELLDAAAHPLFFPFYLYPFVGIGLYAASGAGRWRSHAYLAASALPCLAVVELFHVEIRYMSPLVLPATVWAAAGIDRLSNYIKLYVITLVILVTGVLTMAYAVYFSGIPRG